MKFGIWASSFLVLGGIAVSTSIGQAETLHDALVAAYSNNPTLNAARAGQRATNENVPLALSGRRPTVTATGQIGAQTNRTFNSAGFAAGGNNDFAQGNIGLSLSQNVFNGFQVQNNIKAAEAGVKAGFENLRNTEQTILTQVVTAYVDVLRDRKIVRLQEQDVAFSREQVRAARAQRDVGEGTRTDVALAEAQLASSLTELAVARSNLRTSEATYVQIVGKRPGSLSPASPAVKFLPSSLSDAISISQREHPLVRAAQHNVDSGQFNVKVAEGTLLPSVTLNGSYQRSFQAGTLDSNTDVAQVTADISLPLYSGGSRFSQIRQSKETVGQLRIQVDEVRRSIEQAVRSSWSALQSARSQIRSAQSNVRASQVAVEGLIEERKVGQQTTLDVLIAQSNLIDAQVVLENAARDRIVASYNLLSSIGRFDAERVRVAQRTNVESPKIHYAKVRDKWFGLRTPSGQ
ncbi:MAG: TolC family outer membrane protein [Pseudomonadota bacterium]